MQFYFHNWLRPVAAILGGGGLKTNESIISPKILRPVEFAEIVILT